MTLLAKIFEDMPQSFRPEKAIGFKGCFNFICSGSDAGQFNVLIADHKIFISQVLDKNPDVTIHVSSETWIAISTGQMDGIQAYLNGSIKVTGNLKLFQYFPKLFKRPTPNSGKTIEELIQLRTSAFGKPIAVEVGTLNDDDLLCLKGNEASLRSFLEGNNEPSPLFLEGGLSYRGNWNTLRNFWSLCEQNPFRPLIPKRPGLLKSLFLLALRPFRP